MAKKMQMLLRFFSALATISILMIAVFYMPAIASHDVNSCNDHTAIPGNVRQGGSEDSFCSTHGGYSGQPPISGPREGLQFGDKPAPNDVCGRGEQAVEISINIGCNQGVANPLLDGSFAIIRFLSVGVGVIVVASIVVAGIQYTTSMGNPERTLAAVKRIRAALIALLLYIFMFALIQWLVPGGLF